MPRFVHTVAVADGSDLLRSDHIVLAQLTVSIAAGGSAGAAVTTAVAMKLPPSYKVQATPNQDAVAYIAAKTATGFNLVVNPRLAANTIAAGTVDLLITA